MVPESGHRNATSSRPPTRYAVGFTTATTVPAFLTLLLLVCTSTPLGGWVGKTNNSNVGIVYEQKARQVQYAPFVIGCAASQLPPALTEMTAKALQCNNDEGNAADGDVGLPNSTVNLHPAEDSFISTPTASAKGGGGARSPGIGYNVSNSAANRPTTETTIAATNVSTLNGTANSSNNRQEFASGDFVLDIDASHVYSNTTSNSSGSGKWGGGLPGSFPQGFPAAGGGSLLPDVIVITQRPSSSDVTTEAPIPTHDVVITPAPTASPPSSQPPSTTARSGRDDRTTTTDLGVLTTTTDATLATANTTTGASSSGGPSEAEPRPTLTTSPPSSSTTPPSGPPSPNSDNTTTTAAAGTTQQPRPTSSSTTKPTGSTDFWPVTVLPTTPPQSSSSATPSTPTAGGGSTAPSSQSPLPTAPTTTTAQGTSSTPTTTVQQPVSPTTARRTVPTATDAWPQLATTWLRQPPPLPCLSWPLPRAEE